MPLSDRNKMDEDNARILDALRENTDMTRKVMRILDGEPEYKRLGLVEIVDGHDVIIKKFTGGKAVLGAFCFLIFQVLLALISRR